MNQSSFSEYNNPFGTASVPLRTALLKAAWSLTAIALWPYRSITLTEKAMAVLYIKRYFLHSSYDPYTSYLIFCERVLLIREHINNQASVAISPGLFFLPQYVYGFELYVIPTPFLQASRKNYQLRLSVAEAVMDIQEEATAANFIYWLDWFHDRGAYEEMMVFFFIAKNDIG